MSTKNSAKSEERNFLKLRTTIGAVAPIPLNIATCGGAVVKPTRMHLVAQLASMRAEKTKKMMKLKKIWIKINTSAVYAEKQKVMSIRTDPKIPTIDSVKISKVVVGK